MDGGDWAVLAAILGGGSLLFVLADRFFAGRVPMPLGGGPKVLYLVGLLVSAAGAIGLSVWAAVRYRRVRASSAPRDHVLEGHDVDTIWAILPTTALVLGIGLVVVAIAAGRRRDG